jgi:hypothetical protein
MARREVREKMRVRVLYTLSLASLAARNGGAPKVLRTAISDALQALLKSRWGA